MKYNAAATHAIRFVENLTLVGDKSGEPVKLLPFQKHILGTIFGVLDRAKRRKIKKVFLFLPRKQAKTFLVACVVIYWLLGRGLKGQQCLSIANDREQAALLFSMARQMLEADHDLSELVEIVPSTKRITVPAANSFYAALSCEATTKTGFNPSLVIIDEAQDQRDADLIKNLTSGRSARDDYLTLYVGTAGKRKDTVFYEEYEYAKQWLADKAAGKPVPDNYYAWVYEADEQDDPYAESTWRKCLPAYGKFCNPQAIKDEAELAKLMPHEESKFRQYTLNQWQIYAGTKWVTDQVWMQNASAPLHDAKDYWAGFDGASVRDTSSFLLYGRNSRGKWDVIPFVWVCQAQVDERDLRGDADFSYKLWKEQGYLRVTPGSAQDQEWIANDIQSICARYKIRKLSIDRVGLSWLSQKFLSFGLDVVGFGQDLKSQSEPIKVLEKQLLSGEISHGGHPVLRWMCNNVKTWTDGADNIKFHKGHSEDKIDGMQALANAVGVAYPLLAAEEFGKGRSVYERRGLLVI